MARLCVIDGCDEDLVRRAEYPGSLPPCRFVALPNTAVILVGASDAVGAGISAAAALLGAAVGAAVTWLVERKRQEHQEAMREQQDLDVARGLARVLLEDLLHGASHLALSGSRFFSVSPEPANRP